MLFDGVKVLARGIITNKNILLIQKDVLKGVKVSDYNIDDFPINLRNSIVAS